MPSQSTSLVGDPAILALGVVKFIDAAQRPDKPASSASYATLGGDIFDGCGVGEHMFVRYRNFNSSNSSCIMSTRMALDNSSHRAEYRTRWYNLTGDKPLQIKSLYNTEEQILTATQCYPSGGEPQAHQAVVTETPFPSETSGEDLLDITEENALYCFAGGIAQRFLENRPADCIRKRQQEQADHDFLLKRMRHEVIMKEKDMQMESRRLAFEESKVAFEEKRLTWEKEQAMMMAREREEDRRARAEERKEERRMRAEEKQEERRERAEECRLFAAQQEAFIGILQGLLPKNNMQ
ncbi:hypothetical protein MTO96_028783 [Rhipicephalus appendiculatus]